MGECLSDPEDAFNFWLSLHAPEWFFEDSSEEKIPIDALNQLRSQDKASFLKGFLQYRRERRAADAT